MFTTIRRNRLIRWSFAIFALILSTSALIVWSGSSSQLNAIERNQDPFVDLVLRDFERKGGFQGSLPEAIYSERSSIQELRSLGLLSTNYAPDCNSDLHVVVVRGNLYPSLMTPGALGRNMEDQPQRYDYMLFRFLPDSGLPEGGFASHEGAEFRELLGKPDLPDPGPHWPPPVAEVDEETIREAGDLDESTIIQYAACP